MTQTTNTEPAEQTSAQTAAPAQDADNKTAAQAQSAASAQNAEAWSVTLDKDFADILKPQADRLKEFGLSQEQAQKFVDAAAGEMRQNIAALKAEEDALTAKWGGKENTERNKQTALETMAKLGFDEEDAAALTRALGASRLYEKFFELSKKMGADSFKEFTGSSVVYQPGNIDAAQAQAQVNRLYEDPEFMAKINANDPEACKRLDYLIDKANGLK